jgi:CheY-like chemotaxis protein
MFVTFFRSSCYLDYGSRRLIFEPAGKNSPRLGFREYRIPLCCHQMRRKRILIVEDDTDLRRMFRTALAMAGYDVDEAGDGVDALRMVENRAPDLIVLDLVLRWLDGISVQQELAARPFTRDIPIVIVTGSSLDTGGLEVACVLRKPVMPDDLIRTVQRCIATGSAASGA